MARVRTLPSSATGTNLHCFMNRWVRTFSSTGTVGYSAPEILWMFKWSDKTARQSRSEMYPRSTSIFPSFSRDSAWRFRAVRSSSSSTRPRSRKTCPTRLRDLSASTLILNDLHPLLELFPAIFLVSQLVQISLESPQYHGLVLILIAREVPVFDKHHHADRLIFSQL